MFPFPVFINHREPKCPECGEPENIKQTCRHCGYEYDEDNELNFKDVLFIMFAVIVFVWAIITLMMWFAERENTSLIGLIIAQIKAVMELRIW